MKKIQLLLLFLLMGILVGCGNKQSEEKETAELRPGQIYAYFVNKDQTGLVPIVYTLKDGKDVSEQAGILMQYLEETTGSAEYQAPIPGGIVFQESRPGSRYGTIEVSFSIRYDAVDAQSLLFFKGCVVMTLTQLDDVERVSILLTDVANSDAETATVSETFDADSFAMSFGGENGYLQKGAIVLYFANASGEMLKDYRKIVEISNNTSLARVVVESLIAGPQGEDYLPTISSETTIRNISVKDGICYVDLSDEFYDTDNQLRNDIIVYSIVNSLVELPTVSKVQFLNNGEKQQFFRETLPFDGIFERNLDLIEQEESKE